MDALGYQSTWDCGKSRLFLIKRNSIFTTLRVGAAFGEPKRETQGDAVVRARRPGWCGLFLDLQLVRNWGFITGECRRGAHDQPALGISGEHSSSRLLDFYLQRSIRLTHTRSQGRLRVVANYGISKMAMGSNGETRELLELRAS